MRKSSLGLLAVLALVIAACGGVTPEAAGPSEGIQVHGDWTIDIYNEDGSLDERMEFSNALTSGAALIAFLLSGELEFGVGNAPRVTDWIIAFGEGTSTPGSDPCDIDITSTVFSANPDFALGCVISTDDTLELSRNTDGDAVTLLGSTQVANDGAINWVETFVGGTGQTLFLFTFTGTTVGEKVVSAGQIVQVQVDISFTSG